MRFLEKSRGLVADSVAYDLEDSVTPTKKPDGRRNILEILNRDRVPGIREQAVRINSVGSGFALDDLTEILKGKHLDCLVVPKVDSASDLHFVTDVLRQKLPERHAEGSSNPVQIVALVESARSVMDLSSICRASPYLSGLTFAAEDPRTVERTFSVGRQRLRQGLVDT